MPIIIHTPIYIYTGGWWRSTMMTRPLVCWWGCGELLRTRWSKSWKRFRPRWRRARWVGLGRGGGRGEPYWDGKYFKSIILRVGFWDVKSSAFSWQSCHRCVDTNIPTVDRNECDHVSIERYRSPQYLFSFLPSPSSSIPLPFPPSLSLQVLLYVNILSHWSGKLCLNCNCWYYQLFHYNTCHLSCGQGTYKLCSVSQSLDLVNFSFSHSPLLYLSPFLPLYLSPSHSLPPSFSSPLH